jgi:hypothetical protein
LGNDDSDDRLTVAKLGNDTSDGKPTWQCFKADESEGWETMLRTANRPGNVLKLTRVKVGKDASDDRLTVAKLGNDTSDGKPT